jgi:hypothetical protein
MKTLALALLVLVTAAPATACPFPNTFDFQYIAQATVVFRGEVVAYEPPKSGIHKAFITFKVLQTYHGPSRETWRLSWRNATFGLPKQWNRPDRLLVAATTRLNRFEEVFRLDEGEPRVLQDICTMAFLLDDTARNLSLLTQALKVVPTAR